MDSKIYLDEKVENRDRRFGSQLEYYPTKIVIQPGEMTSALFTKHQIDEAIARAERNPEDMPGESFWQKLFLG